MRYFYLTPMLGAPGAPRFPITDRIQMIGRSDRADVALVEPTVSRQHATIQCVDGRVLLKDLGSKHGTFVNSRRVTSVTLKVGDIVVFGLSLVLRLEDSDKPVPAAEGMRAGSSSTDFMEGDLAVTAIRTVTIPPRSVKRAVSTTTEPSGEDIGRIQSQMAKVHKLAGAGAISVQLIPELVSRLSSGRAQVAQLAADEPALREALAFLDQALSVGQRLLSALSLLPRRRLEPISLAEPVREAIEAVSGEAESRRVKLLSEIGAEHVVLAEAPRLGHAVAEVLRNAVQHSAASSVVQLLATRQDDQVVLTVSDQGEGFPPEILERACDPFVTRSGEWEAVGLGLFEARQIVMASGGSLEVESKPGLGSTVRLLLPAAR